MKKKFNIYIFIIIIKDNSSFECLKTIIWINGIMTYFVSYSTSFHNIYNPNSNIFLFNLFFLSISISLTYSNRHTCKWHFYVTCLSQAASVCSQTYTHTPTKKKTKANKYYFLFLKNWLSILIYIVCSDVDRSVSHDTFTYRFVRTPLEPHHGEQINMQRWGINTLCPPHDLF